MFQLGTKYSEAMNATYADENGDDKPFIMGCYGVGVSRSMAAVVEQHNDEHGIKWPISVAPAEVAVIQLVLGDDLVEPIAESVASGLAAAGVETVLDDRDERPGFKFNDADLYGWPFQITVGKRGVQNGQVELKVRETGEKSVLPIGECVEKVAQMVCEQRARYAH